MISRSLLNLPPLVHGANHWSLPMCDATAMALASALLAADSAAGAEPLTGALSRDPALAIWAMWHAAQVRPSSESGDFPRTIAALSQWLHPQLLRLLDWSGDAEVVPYSAEQQSRFAALVAESVGSAHELARANGGAEVQTAPDFLAVLTTRWRDWLAATRSEPNPPQEEFPAWPLEAAVLREAASDGAKAAADEAWRRWLLEIPNVGSLLQSVIARLRQAADLENRFEERLHTAKLEALKEFAYGAGHELNNPLANIASRAQTLLKEETHPERRRRLAAINTQAFRAHEMLADMMLFARPPQLVRQSVDIVPLVADVLAELAEQAAEQQTVLHAPVSAHPVQIHADPVQLRVALRALCINSLEALGHGGNITIEAHMFSPSPLVGEGRGEGASKNTGAVQIVVSDDGTGIPPEIQGKIFDPFFSGREAGRGLGFGLSKCWRIVTLHGGRIEVECQSRPGAIFTITLPTGS